MSLFSYILTTSHVLLTSRLCKDCKNESSDAIYSIVLPSSAVLGSMRLRLCLMVKAWHPMCLMCVTDYGTDVDHKLLYEFSAHHNLLYKYDVHHK